MAITLNGTVGIDTPTLTGLTTPLTVSVGGTGAATLTSGSVLVGAGTSAVTGVAPSTSGNVLTSNGSAWVSQAGGVADGSITDPKVASLSAGTTYIPIQILDYANGAGVSSTSYTKRNELVAFRAGSYRFTGVIGNNNTGTPTTMTVSCQIYLNGVATGSVISASIATNSKSGTLTFTDVTVAKGDLVQFYVKGSVSTAAAYLDSLNIGNSVAWGFNALSSNKPYP
jgi:hypothetical protein